jgi:hypothetical protein
VDPVLYESLQPARDEFRYEKALRPRWQVPIDVFDLPVARDEPWQQLSQLSLDYRIDGLQLSG